MKVIIFGATGMVGQGVLRECLIDPDVNAVLSVGRRALGQTHAKLLEIVKPDLFDLAPAASELRGFDACLFCLGVSSAGMSERDYRRITYDLTLAAAFALLTGNPGMTFIYVSGKGTDSSARGRFMWARVKGETENALLRLPFKAAVMFRPAAIIPLHGVTSNKPLYRLTFALTRPLWPVLRRFPRYVTTTEQLGRAMLHVAKNGSPKPILESVDINAL
jgi:uncharacterized protein YbjT (DUF2867 family)